MDEVTRLRWACTILEYVRREGRWGLKDVDALRHLLRPQTEEAWLHELEPALRRWYGEPLPVPPEVLTW